MVLTQEQASKALGKVSCPDCHKELDEVNVEKWMLRRFTIDYANKTLVPVAGSKWEDEDDNAIRCPHCDSLNVDDMFTGFKIRE